MLGTAGGGLRPPRATSAIHVAHRSGDVLLDCGPGATWRLLERRLQPRRVQALLISHLHMDHIHGLPELLAHSLFPAGDLPAMFLGPPGTDAYVRAALALTLPSVAPAPPVGPFAVEETLDDERTVAGLRIITREVPHAPGFLAVARRVEAGGGSLVYSGDCLATPEVMVPLAEGAHTLVHEAWSEPGVARRMAEVGGGLAGEGFRAAYCGTHSDVTVVARMAREAGVKRLVLTHFHPGERAEEIAAIASGIFPGEVLAADDGLAFDASD